MFNSFEISINVNWIMISPAQPSSSQLYSIKVHCHGRFISTIPAWDSWKLERSTQICKQIEGSLAVSLDATSVIPSNTFSRNTCCLITRLLSLLYSYLRIVFYFRLELSSPGVMWCYIEGRTWTERKTSCSGVCIVKVLHRGRPGVGWPSQRGPSPSSTPWSSFHTILVICRVGQVKPITIRYLERPGTPLDSDWQCCWVGLKIVINILLSLL